MHDGTKRLDSSQEAKVQATMTQAGSEGRIVREIFATGNIPSGDR
jgi:hypothetical protein